MGSVEQNAGGLKSLTHVKLGFMPAAYLLILLGTVFGATLTGSWWHVVMWSGLLYAAAMTVWCALPGSWLPIPRSSLAYSHKLSGIFRLTFTSVAIGTIGVTDTLVDASVLGAFSLAMGASTSLRVSVSKLLKRSLSARKPGPRKVYKHTQRAC